MPPKKTNSGASKKTEIKKKEKVIEVSSELTTYLIYHIKLSIYWLIHFPNS